MKRIALLAILCFTSYITAIAQNKPDPYTVSLKSGNVTMPVNALSFIDSVITNKIYEEQQVIVQFYRLPDAAEQQALKIRNFRLLNYLSSNAYTAIIDYTAVRDLPLANIRSIRPMLPEWKMDARVQQLALQPNAKKSKVAVSFIVSLSADDIRKLIAKHRGEITSKKFASQNVYELELANSALLSMTREAMVTYVSIAAHDVPLNNDQRSITGAAFLEQTTGLDGTDITVGYGDNSTALFHTDTRDRVTNFNPDPPELHGQHVSGTIAGKGIIDPKGKGMAPGASLLGHLYNIVWAQTQPMFTDYNMTLTNNSYAAVVGDCAIAGTYDNYSQMLDNLANQFPQVLNVFASGNDGQATCPPYPIGYGTVCGIYQSAKNVLTVGSMRRTYTDHEESAKGPVKDGRIKPEVVSIGADLYSTALYDNYVAMTGTSMACPGATGALALLSQRYKQLNGNNNAPNALLKAVLMNGASDVGTPGPDYRHGFGIINLYRSIDILNNNRILQNTATQGSTQNVSISVPANTAQLKVLLYWNDAAANPSAATTLVNDLNLTVMEPNGNWHRPLVLDPTPGNVTNPAVEKVDNLNNVEQVVINNPQAGNFAVAVSGGTVPSATQQYYLVYDFIPSGITLKYPSAGAAVPAGETINVFWDASDDVNSYTLEYSDNNGTSWNMIDNNIAAAKKFFAWTVPNISTSQALMRLTRNTTGMQAVTGQFVISPQPVLQADAVQCPGYFAFNWNAAANASGYQVLQKIGDDLIAIDTVLSTSYVLKGLPFNTIQYVSVAPLINGIAGYRSKALNRLPNDGTCTGTISDNDLAIDTVTVPQSGRKFTSTELSANTSMDVVVRNLDDAPNSNYRISYKVNGNSWMSQNFTATLPASTSATVTLPGLNLSVAGLYHIVVAIENLNADPVRSNDTFNFSARQLLNDPLDITTVFTETFEGMGRVTLFKDTTGILTGDHWDYANTTDSGRLRTFVGNDVTITGQHSLSMDLLYSLPDNRNYLYGTFNLSNYSVTNTEARLEFDYKLHGTPKTQEGNDIFVRGNDTQPWVKLSDIDTNIAEGVATKTGSLSITNALANGGQNFSSSFQVRIGQHDTSAIAANEYGNGLTIDNFKLYSVKNDVQLLSILNPVKLNCGLAASEPISIKVYNSDNLGQSGIQLFYRYDNGPVVSETLDTLAPKDTIDFTFTQPVNSSGIGHHMLDVWLVANGDSYLSNDSILNYQFRNQPVVTTYPYLEHFEDNDGDWFSDGTNNTWQYGTPASDKINKAASGSKVWKTNLAGKYNNNEEAHLYSPCFDLSGLSNPMLSFSLATDIENCGEELCDRAYMEYSEDGKLWIRLDEANAGTNWYNDIKQHVWNEQDKTRWRVASISLPQSNSLKLRFVFRSDPGASREGIAVDDIHIFDLHYPIYDDATLYSATAEGTDQQDFLSNEKLLARLSPNGQSLGPTTVSAYFHRSAYHPLFHQYFVPRNYTIQASSDPATVVTTRLYITDAEFMKMADDGSCADCEKAENAYRLGILKYEDAASSHENGSLLDNDKGVYSFIPFTDIRWVPYDKGYYAEWDVTSFSEFWFTTGLPQRKVSDVVIFPNPLTDGRLHIAWHGKPLDRLEINIFDAVGKSVYRAEATAQDADNLSTFLLPKLSSGMYIVKYRTTLQSGEVKLLNH